MDGVRSLPDAAHEHHAAINAHVDRMTELAETIGRVEPAELQANLRGECEFLVGELQPHMAAIETALYGRLEQLMEGRHSLGPMRDEHARVRRLIASVCEASERVRAMTDAEQIGLRRVLYRLHSILKVHLAEEELYLGVLDRNLSAGEKDALARAIEHAGAHPL